MTEIAHDFPINFCLLEIDRSPLSVKPSPKWNNRSISFTFRYSSPSKSTTGSFFLFWAAVLVVTVEITSTLAVRPASRKCSNGGTTVEARSTSLSPKLCQKSLFLLIGTKLRASTTWGSALNALRIRKKKISHIKIKDGNG